MKTMNRLLPALAAAGALWSTACSTDAFLEAASPACGELCDALVAIDRIPHKQRTAEVLFGRARLLLENKRIEEARSELLAALKQQPNHAAILRMLMRVEGRLGRIGEAEKLIEAAASENPKDAELIRLRGSFALRAGDVETAEAMFKKALELDPSSVAAFRELAQIYQTSNRIDEAITTYQDALVESPDSAQVHYLLAVLHQAKDETALAIAGYEKAISLDKNMALPKNNLAYIFAESGANLDRALDLAQEAKALLPQDPTTSDTLGWVLYRRGIMGAAVGYLREAVAGLEPGSTQIAVARHHLALAYEANDQKQLAIEALELSLAELEEKEGKARAQGGTPEAPAWSSPARELLERLKSAG